MQRVAWKQLVVILLVALMVRLAALWAWHQRVGDGFGFPDSESYWQLAQRIAAGEEYVFRPAGQVAEYRVFRTPGYPLALAPIFWIADGRTAVRWARLEAVVFGTVCVILVWLIAWRLFGRRVATTAAAWTAVYPEAVASSVFILSESAFCPAVLLHLWLWIEAELSPEVGRRRLCAIASGAMCGLAVLIRPSWLLFAPLVCAGMLLRVRMSHLLSIGRADTAGKRASIRTCAVILAVATIVLIPWWLRNAIVTGRFVPTTLQVGASLYDGLNPSADGSSEMSFVADFLNRVPIGPEAPPTDHIRREIKLDRMMRTAAWHWVIENPGKVIELAVRKLLRMWLPGPNDAALSSGPIRLAVGLTYTATLFGAVVGWLVGGGRSWPVHLLWIPAVYLSGLHIVFVGSIRYRLPAIFGLIVLAAYGWLRLLRMHTMGLPDGADGVGY